MTDEEKKAEQDKLLTYLKDKYPNSDIEITQFFRNITKRYGVNDNYIIKEIYAKIENFVKFNHDYYLLLRPFADNKNLKPCASLREEGFQYLNILKEVKNKKWTFRLSIVSALVTIFGLAYNIFDKTQTIKKQEQVRLELKKEMLDSIESKTNHLLDSLTKKKP